jgi:Flp pilus assembly pilin Flp
LQRIANRLGSLVASEYGGDVIEHALLTALLAIIAVEGLSIFANNHLLKFYNNIAAELQKNFKQVGPSI